MEKSLFQKYREPVTETAGPKIRNARDEMIQKFADRLNVDRMKAGYPKWAVRYVAVMLSPVDTENLWPLYKKCETKRAFGAWLKWELSPKNAPSYGQEV